jgi:hypothetical protein
MSVFTVLLFFCIGLVGLTHIIVDSKIMSKWREYVEENDIPFLGYKLHDLLTCHQCCGFWVGLLGGPWAIPFLSIKWTMPKLVAMPVVFLLCGCAISLLTMVSRAFIDWLTLNVQIPEELWNESEEKTEQT